MSNFLVSAVRTYAAIGFATGMAATVASGATLTVDASNVHEYPTLSAAVDYVERADNGPHQVNYKVDVLPTPDGEVLISEPITINGDADGNGVKLDILVDLEALNKIAPRDSRGQKEKSYIEIQSPGAVTLQDLKIHPNGNGSRPGARAEQYTGAIRTFRPENASDKSAYTFKNVWVSGSAADNSYVSLETGLDIYSSSKKWSAGDATKAIIHLTDGGGAGFYNAVLDHCQAGVGYSGALIMENTSGINKVLGGLYGHCGQDAILCKGTGIVLKGAANDRLRVVRPTNISGKDSHAIEVDGGNVAQIAYVDVLGMNTSNLLKLRDATVAIIDSCRFMGKVGTPKNQCMFVQGDCAVIAPITRCTFVGTPPNGAPLFCNVAFKGTLNFKDCIFATEDPQASIGINGGNVNFNNCAIPTAGTGVNEKLSIGNPVITDGQGEFTSSKTIDQTPIFKLTAKDYIWSDTSNPDVLRPTNPVYEKAASDGSSALSGGCGDSGAIATASN